MNRLMPAWISLMYGLGFGVFIAFMNGIAFPIILECTGIYEAIYNGMKWHGMIGAVAPDIWINLFILGIRYLAVPSIIGSVIMFLCCCYLKITSNNPNRFCPISGIITGNLVSIGGVLWLYEADWRWDFRDGWAFAILVWIWNIVIFTWLGVWIARRSIQMLSTDWQ